MAGKYLLDTNIVIALFEGARSVVQRLGRASQVFVPSITVGELFYGAYQSTHVQENLQRIEEFVAVNTVLACDAATAELYGHVKSRLQSKGRSLPDNDIWIAALARQHGLTLVSRDVHFKEIERLRLEAW
ncbi:MAG: type II toxin-antitoxin system VapC family toxin [Gemmataceae bacterium]